MRALSLMQPWATLVVLGHKTIETRRWTTAHRGPLAIHASLSKAGREVATLSRISRLIPNFDALPFGAVLGTVTLTGVERTENLELSPTEFARQSLEEHAFGNGETGRWVWMLAEPRLLSKVIPAKGALGLWDFPESFLTS